jgi:hypothetical protein
MWPRRAALAALLSMAAIGPAEAQRPATLEDAAWLAGRWVGGGDLGEAESSWSPPYAGQMGGHYILRSNGRIIFYELMILDETADGLRLSVKHFTPSFRAWETVEQWQRFEPRGLSGDEIHFDGVVMRRIGEDQHSATVTHQDAQTGALSETTFTYRRAPL